jgi:hypothetical protein
MDNDGYTVDNDPRQRALEAFGRTGSKLAGNALEVGVNAARAMQNALFPDEFEYYALTLEIVNSKGESIEWLTFPVMPESITYDDQSVVNIQKTIGGIVAMDSSTYTPKTISLSGTFGRKFRLLLQPREVITKASEFSISDENSINVTSAKKRVEFDPRLKTGYGATKLLQRIMELSSSVDEEGQPYRMYLYLPPLGQNFLVKRNAFQLSQEVSSSNMMWRYSVQLTSIAPLENVVGADVIKKSLQNTLVISVLQRGAISAANTVSDSIRQLVGTRAGNQ